jgi:hypothetical protein
MTAGTRSNHRPAGTHQALRRADFHPVRRSTSLTGPAHVPGRLPAATAVQPGIHRIRRCRDADRFII